MIKVRWALYLLPLVAQAAGGCGSDSYNRSPAGIAGEAGDSSSAGGSAGSNEPTSGGTGGTVSGGGGGDDTGGRAGDNAGGTGGEGAAGAGGEPEAGSGGTAGAGGDPLAGSGGEAGDDAGGTAGMVAGAGGEALGGSAGGEALGGSAGGEAVGGSAGASGAGAVAEAGAGGAPPVLGGAGGEGGAPDCLDSVDMFPVPVSDQTSLFATTDNSNLAVDFELGFTFDFFGNTYNRIYINTNGGMTFGVGSSMSTPNAENYTNPAIAPFWGDMDASLAPNRESQLAYQQCVDRFIVAYKGIADAIDENNAHNTAIVTLLRDGTIWFEYGEVLSQAFMAGVVSGQSRGSYLYDINPDTAPQASYDYGSSSNIPGVVLLNSNGEGGELHTGWLSNQFIAFLPR